MVSAMSKITDLLLDTMRHAEAGDGAGMSRNLDALRSRHEEACRGLLCRSMESSADSLPASTRQRPGETWLASPRSERIVSLARSL